jgi:hypothetical protein
MLRHQRQDAFLSVGCGSFEIRKLLSLDTLNTGVAFTHVGIE